MGVGLWLEGKRRLGAGADRRDVGPWLGKVEQWALQQLADLDLSTWCARREDGSGTLGLRLHPAAEDVEIRATPPDGIVLSAKTSTVGPGYHDRVCRLADALGRAAGIAWEAPDASQGTGDETGYFVHRDRGRLEAEMLGWLKGVAAHILTMTTEGELEAIALSLELTHHFEGDGAVLTPLGPRDLAWLRAAASDPRSGLDVFPWWPIGDEAALRLGRALARMWTDVRWRAPVTDEERLGMERILQDLERAWAADPQRAYPVREWHELAGFLGAKIPRGVPAAPVGGSPIGYRRRPVTVDVGGGWSVRLPGDLAERWEDGGSTFCAFDAERTVRISTLAATLKGGVPPSATQLVTDLSEEFPAEGRVERRDGPIAGRAAISAIDDGDDRYFQLQGCCAVAGHGAILTVCYPRARERAWAIETWRSLARRPDENG